MGANVFDVTAVGGGQAALASRDADYSQVGNLGDTLGSRAEVPSSVGDKRSPAQATGMYSCRCWKPLPSAATAV